MKQAIGFILLVLVACTPDNRANIVVLDESVRTCFGFETSSTIAFSCTEDETHAFIETNGEEIAFRGYESAIVVRGTVEISRRDNLFIIRVATGTAVVSARGRTRVIPENSQLELALIDGIAQAPSDPSASNATAITETIPNALEIAQTSPTATFEGDCLPRADWGIVYTVKAGDVLEEIAEDFGLTIAEIAEGNCLANPNRLRIGQVLRIPGDTPTATPSAIAFRADSFTLQVGNCTTLRWDVFNVAAVFIDDNETTANNFLEVCPEASTTYKLRVVFLDERETERELTITVESVAEATAEP